MPRKIEVTNNGKKVGLNHFLREATVNIILGLFKALKGVDITKEITIRIGEEEEEES